MPESAAIPHRVGALERRQDSHREWLQKLDEGTTIQAVTAARHEERLDGHDDAINRLADTVNKGVWALVGFSFTIAASAVGLAITLGGTP
jgi:hypothetical protein